MNEMRNLKLKTGDFNRFEITRKIGIIYRKADEMSLDFRYDRNINEKEGYINVSVTGNEKDVSDFIDYVRKYFVIL